MLTKILSTLSRTMAMLVIYSFQGFVTKMLWGWFLVPLGVPAVTTAHALGITFLAQHLRPSMIVSSELGGIPGYDAHATMTPMQKRLVLSVLALAAGFVLKTFLM